MFDSYLKEPREEFDFDFCNLILELIPQVEQFPLIFNVACSEGNLKTAEHFFLAFMKNVSGPQEVMKFEKSLTSKKSSKILQYFSSVNEFDIVGRVSKKFSARVVEDIFQAKFECEDGSKTDLLTFVLLNGENLGNLLIFIKQNLLLNQDFVDFFIFKINESETKIVQKILGLKRSKQKVEACKELLEIQKTYKIKSTAISIHFRHHFKNSDPENFLLLDALKVGDFEAFKMLVEFVDDLSVFPRIFSKLLQFYLSKFGDQFNVLQLLREGLSSGSVKSNQFESCFESIKILVDHFPEDSRSLLEVLLNRSRDKSDGNFLATILDPKTTEEQFNFHIRSLQDIKKLLDFQIYKKLILNLFDELIFSSRTKVCLNLEEARVIEFLDVLGLDLARELVVRENQNISQIQDHDLIKSFYRSVLNYFDEKTGQKSSSFEQLKLEAIKQLSIDFNFTSFAKFEKKQPKLNSILIDLQIFRESSDGFRFVNNRDVEVFGFAKFREILNVTDDFIKTFKKVREMEPGLMQSFLARNSIGQSFFHFLVGSGFQNSSIIEFLGFLKVHFGSEFVWEILKLKNNEGLTFWSHAFANKNISSLEEIKFGSFFEEILRKIFEKKIDFENLKKLASDSIFRRENFERKFHEDLVEIGVLAKVDGKIKFSDPSFLNYFSFEEFHDFLKKNYENMKTIKICGKLLSDRENFSELCWLIEKFFAQNLEATKKALNYLADFGEENEAAFFLCLDILINQLKSGKSSETAKNLLFGQDEEKQTFLHKFCFNENWNEKSFQKLFQKLKELKKKIRQNEFKELLMHHDFLHWTFLQYLHNFKKFEIAFDFLCSEFGLDFLRDFFLLSGKGFFCVQSSITEFTKVLDLYKNNNFGKEFVKTFLMRKGSVYNENFLLYFYDYSDLENCSDLLKLFDLIFSICGADLELFNDLFYSKSKYGNQTFFEKLKETYEVEKLKLITDWIEKNLGHGFLKK
jgi:hypothetical protein